MAALNEILDGRLNEALSRRLGMKTSGPAPTLMPEIAFQFDSVTMPELLVHQGWRSWTGGGNAGATAAQNGSGMLRNPAGSGVIAILESARFAVGGAGIFFPVVTVGLTADLATLCTARNACDTRQPGAATSGSSLRVSKATAVGAFLQTTPQIQVQAGVTIELITRPQILLPDTSFAVTASPLNSDVIFLFQWRERAFVPNEDTA